MVATKLFEPGAGRMRVDRYELVGEIASGGMATVYLARLGGVGGFQRFVAMKRLHPHLQNEKEFVEMFLDEARLSAGIHHPNVVSILEVGASPVGYYLVMEYVEGDTLARILARAASKGDRIPTPIALRIVIERGPVTLRVGSTASGDEYINETVLRTGTHSLEIGRASCRERV